MSAKRPLRSSVVTTLSNLSKRSIAARSDRVRLRSCRLTRQFETYTLLIPENRWRVQVAQSFDHASSLGRELRVEIQDRLLAANRVGDYVERGHGAIFWSEDEHRGPSPLQLVRLAVGAYADSFRPALRKVVRLDQSAVDEVVDPVPNDWMSPSARSFAIELMSYTHISRQLAASRSEMEAMDDSTMQDSDRLADR